MVVDALRFEACRRVLGRRVLTLGSGNLNRCLRARQAHHASRMTATVSDEDVRQIARRALADERTVWKRLAGGQVRGRVGERIDREIAAYRTGNASGARPPRKRRA